MFRWDKLNGWWYGGVRNKVFKIKQVNSNLEYSGVDTEFLVRHFGLDIDLQQISLQIGKDEFIRKALAKFWGLRLIRQDPWECLISYICATYKNIGSIKGMLRQLSKKFGQKLIFDGMDFYTFPTSAALANADERELVECGLGYRAKYVLETSKEIHSKKVELEKLKQLPYMEAKKHLLSLPGVGQKVADCVLLFSLEKHEAFPVDVWIKRVLLNHYASHLPTELTNKLLATNNLSNKEYNMLNEFGRSYFGAYAGYAQEYLYHCQRTQKNQMRKTSQA